MADYLMVEAGIRRFHALYADAVFRKDYVAFGDCFTEDAEWRIAGRVMRGRANIVALLQKALANSNRVIMNFRAPILEITPDGVRARTYVTERNGYKDGRPGSTIGTYFERFAQQDGRWRRAWALFQLHYQGPPDLSGSFFEQTDYGPPPAFPPLDAVPPDSSKLG